MEELVRFVKEHEGWIKRKIKRNVSDYYQQEQIYSNFLLALTEKFLDKNVRDFVGLGKIMGTKAAIWFNKTDISYRKHLVYETDEIEKIGVYQPILDEEYLAKAKVEFLLELVENRPGTKRVLKAILDNPTMLRKEIAQLIGINHKLPDQHLMHLRKILAEKEITEKVLEEILKLN